MTEQQLAQALGRLRPPERARILIEAAEMVTVHVRMRRLANPKDVAPVFEDNEVVHHLLSRAIAVLSPRDWGDAEVDAEMIWEAVHSRGEEAKLARWLEPLE